MFNISQGIVQWLEKVQQKGSLSFLKAMQIATFETKIILLRNEWNHSMHGFLTKLRLLFLCKHQRALTPLKITESLKMSFVFSFKPYLNRHWFKVMLGLPGAIYVPHLCSRTVQKSWCDGWRVLRGHSCKLVWAAASLKASALVSLRV